MRGYFLYQGNYMSGLRVLDVSRVADGELEEIGFFDTTPDKGGTSMNGIWIVHPYYRSGKLAMAEADFGMWVVLPPPYNH